MTLCANGTKDSQSGSSATAQDDPGGVTINRVRRFQDERTGRTVRQLTDFPTGAQLGYFRLFRQLPDGRMLAWAEHDSGSAILIEPDSGDLTLLPHRFSSLKFRSRDGRNWFLKWQASDAPAGGRRRDDRRRTGELWHIDLPSGQPVCDARLQPGLPGYPTDITIDGRHLILLELEQDLETTPIPTTKDVDAILRYLKRPRRGALHVYEIATGKHWPIFETQDICPSHVDTSPLDPGLVRYCLDMPETQGQRVWTIRIDGSDRRPIRDQKPGEMVTHEFWWADPGYIGYTYQDRRNDPTVAVNPWAEYAQAHTRLGLADLAGREVFLSDPLNSYHSHIYCSPDGRFVCGEGTENNSFVCAAAFSMHRTRVDMVPLATIHTGYVPFRGQNVDCNFSANGRWLIYADKPVADQPHQLFAVEIDL